MCSVLFHEMVKKTPLLKGTFKQFFLKIPAPFQKKNKDIYVEIDEMFIDCIFLKHSFLPL